MATLAHFLLVVLLLLTACVSGVAAMPDPMSTRLLTDAEFHATMKGTQMRDVTHDRDPSVDVWSYVDAVPAADLRGHLVVARAAEHVFRTARDDYDHVMIPTQTDNVFLVVVVDLTNQRVFGHHILDLNAKYGLPTPGRKKPK